MDQSSSISNVQGQSATMGWADYLYDTQIDMTELLIILDGLRGITGVEDHTVHTLLIQISRDLRRDILDEYRSLVTAQEGTRLNEDEAAFRLIDETAGLLEEHGYYDEVRWLLAAAAPPGYNTPDEWFTSLSLPAPANPTGGGQQPTQPADNTAMAKQASSSPSPRPKRVTRSSAAAAAAAASAPPPPPSTTTTTTTTTTSGGRTPGNFAPAGTRWLCPFNGPMHGASKRCLSVTTGQNDMRRHVKNKHFNGRRGWGILAHHWANSGPFKYRELRRRGVMKAFKPRKGKNEPLWVAGALGPVSGAAASASESEEEEDEDDDDDDEYVSEGDDGTDKGPGKGRKDDGAGGSGHGHGMAQLVTV